MEKNKTGKYFKYAIGEIVLVVIGILLALQINNWNENRVAQERIDHRLISLTKDLEADITEIDGIIKACKTRLTIVYETLKRTDRNGTIHIIDSIPPEFRSQIFSIDIDSIINPNADLSTLRTYDGKRPTYNELLNSGEFYLIKNDSLSNGISDYYAECDQLKDQERWNNQETWLIINRSKLRLGLGTYSIDGTLEKLTELAMTDQQFGAELEHEFMLDLTQLSSVRGVKEQAEALIKTINSMN